MASEAMFVHVPIATTLCTIMAAVAFNFHLAGKQFLLLLPKQMWRSGLGKASCDTAHSHTAGQWGCGASLRSLRPDSGPVMARGVGTGAALACPLPGKAYNTCSVDMAGWTAMQVPAAWPQPLMGVRPHEHRPC